jgi:hypothetical protein
MPQQDSFDVYRYFVAGQLLHACVAAASLFESENKLARLWAVADFGQKVSEAEFVRMRPCFFSWLAVVHSAPMDQLQRVALRVYNRHQPGMPLLHKLVCLFIHAFFEICSKLVIKLNFCV